MDVEVLVANMNSSKVIANGSPKNLQSVQCSTAQNGLSEVNTAVNYTDDDECLLLADDKTSNPYLLPRSHRNEVPTVKVERQILGTVSSNYDSLDYDPCENEIFKQSYGRHTSFFVLKQNGSRWVAVFFIGICTALVACCVDIVIDVLSRYKYKVLKLYMDRCVAEDCLAIPYTLWVVISLAFVLIASFIVTYVEPVAGGSGIPLVKSYLNGINIPRLVRFKTLVVKSLGVVCSVLAGLAVGKEGPMVHSGAVIAAGLSQGKTTSMKWDFGFFKYFREDHEKRDFVAAGAAAGVAAAFGAPVGGVLFSLEEGASFWNQHLTWMIFFCSMVSAFTLNVVLSAYHGRPGQLAYPGLLNFGKFEDLPFELWEVPIFIAMGIVGGILGAVFNQCNFYLTIFRRKYLKLKFLSLMEAFLVTIVTVSVGFAMVYFIYDCKPIGEDPIEYPIQMFCKPGEFNAVAALWFQTPEASVRSLFHDPAGTHKPLSVGLFCAIYFLLSCWTYGLSISSGIFIPALLSGAAWGRLLGVGFKHLSPSSTWADPGKYALVGAAAQLGGIVRMTISLTVILIETTGNITFGLPLMLTLMTAKWIGDLFNTGIYDLHVKIAGLPMLPWSAPYLSHTISACQVMSQPVVTIRPVEKVARIVEILRTTAHNAYPVTIAFKDEGDTKQTTSGRLNGLILKYQLVVLLQYKVFCDKEESADQTFLPLSVFQDCYPRYPTINDIKLSDAELAKYVNLRAYMNIAPYTISQDASFPRMYQLFRALGLRHLIVTNDMNEVVGIVTRKDLARYRAAWKRCRLRLEELSVVD